jgi:hypothetical protein
MQASTPRSSRNALPECNVVDLLNALKTQDATFLNEVRDILDLIGLDGDYEGVMVDKSHYDPDEMGRDWAVEILRDISEYIDDARGEVLENGGAFEEEELTLLEKYITDDMAINSDGANATLWFAELSDDTGVVVVVLAQYEDGSRDFLEFSESREETLARFLSNGTKVV